MIPSFLPTQGLRHLRFASLFFLLTLPVLHAELLVSESFDRADTSDDALGMAGATSKGFAADSTWDATGMGNHRVFYATEGLTFPGLATQGGNIRISVTGPADQQGINFFREVADGVSEGGSIYGSFLFRNTQSNGPYLAFLGIEAGEQSPIGEEAPIPHRLADNDLPMLVTFSPDSFSRESTVTQGLKVRRTASEGSLSMGRDEAPLQPDVTYLVVWKIFNSWEGGPPPSNQVTTMWILSEDDFAKLRSESGGPSEDGLDQFHTARIIVDKGNWGRLLEGDFINLGTALADEKGTFSSEFDEIRIGTTLESVLPPSP